MGFGHKSGKLKLKKLQNEFASFFTLYIDFFEYNHSVFSIVKTGCTIHKFYDQCRCMVQCNVMYNFWGEGLHRTGVFVLGLHRIWCWWKQW